MVRMKNKGFSLIEVIVAVAILTLLMAPILVQVSKTLSNSAAAKERQYAVENAEYVLNYVQEAETARLKTLSGKLGTTVTTKPDGSAVSESLDGNLQFTSSKNYEDINCNAWVVGSYADFDTYLVRDAVSETALNSALGGAPAWYPYSATVYTLDDAKLGKKKRTYQRTVILDNLRSKLSAKGLSVETAFSDGAKSALEAKGYTITTEGAAVKYDDTTGLISDIICSKVEGTQSPNGTGTSYMQDLDSTKVAIIQGTASNFDEQAENDLYNLKMNRLKAANPDAWVQAMNSQTGQNVLKGKLYNDNVSKMTRVTIVSGYDNTRKLKYYDVNCTVFYEDYLTSSGTVGGGATDDAAQGISDMTINQSKPDVLTYNAYAHRFYTSQAPDIYMVYEPYVAEGTNYSSNDYLVTYDGVDYAEGEKHAKLYLIKPVKSRIAGGGSGTSSFLTSMNASSPKLVKIYVDQLLRNDHPNDAMMIYTNIDLDNFHINNSIVADSRKGVQYSGNLAQYYGVPKSSKTGDVDNSDVYTLTEISRDQYPEEHIKDIKEDVTVADRVYTVTVQLNKIAEDGVTVEKGNSIRLSGAKGAD